MKKARQSKQSAPAGPWLTIINPSREDEVCPTCGRRAILFSADNTATRQILTRCKPCLAVIAVNEGLEVFVKSTWRGLRELWQNDARKKMNSEQAEQLAAARAKLARTRFSQDQMANDDEG